MRRPTNFDTTQPFGGRLKDYTDEWLENFGYQLATKIVQWGYKPIWNSYPPLSTPPISPQHYISDFDAMEQEISRLLDEGIIRRAWTFITVLQPIIELIRSSGIRIVAYYDDLLIFSRTRREASRRRDFVIDLLESHGFIINERKSQLTPRRSIEYLGYVINSVQMMIAAPEEKIEKLRDECINIYNQHFIQLRSLTSLISKLYNIVKDPECTRELRRDERSHQRRNQNSRIQLSQRARQELEDWIDNIEEWNGYFIITT
ncbi:Transposon Ty3-G Gag-Pol polyprotein [Gigaspora margarita]|uniref:Transposon Ty3-G Gag-Pol polyprotein n=1 Tax=Gigaspora margarita TaxID=4874 RepID=A0A8H3XJM6_GIGMA|nr:Transposon Ty3-G Gag-Pol polyprotein [Gigaspora margarita]